MGKKPVKKEPVVAKKPVAVQNESLSLLDRLNLHFQKKELFYFLICIISALLFGLLLFDVKISIGHDDALYIEAGYKYSKDFFGYYYMTNAPLYPMFLSVPIAIWGINIILLKFLSLIFFLISIFLTWRFFRNRIPYTILFISLFITATNYLFLVHASLTYTETFFAMIQLLFLAALFRVVEQSEQADYSPLRHWQNLLLLGFMLFVQYMTRNVALGSIAAVVIYFLYRKQWKQAGISAVLFTVFVFAFEFVKRKIWGPVSQFSSQANVMFMKDAYNPSQGKEDLPGFIDRFITNTEIYFSSRFWEILGFRKEDSEFNAFITVVTLALIGLGVFFAIRRRQWYILSASLYFIVLCGITFISLHTSWGQGRLVMVYLPFILFAILYGLYELFQKKQLRGYQFFYIVIAFIFLFVNLSLTLKSTNKNIPVLKKNLKGDMFYGYTPDWINFLKASAWCADSLPAGSYVGSRKAPMSFIYGKGKDFFPIYNAPYQDADSLMNHLKSNNVTHLILAELRLNPKKYIPDQYVNTVHRYLGAVHNKYGEEVTYRVFTLVHVEGDNEKAQVVKINYDAIPRSPITSPNTQ